MSSSNPNTRQTIEIVASNGDRFTEEIRNSLGSWANMMTRAAERLGFAGQTPKPAGVNTDQLPIWELGDIIFTATPVEVLR